MRNIILISLLSFSIMSCEDFFETTLELEQPEVPDTFTFNAYVSDEDETVVFAHVSKVIGIDEDISVAQQVIRDAELSITNLDNGNVFQFLPNEAPNNLANYLLTKPPGFSIKNNTYELKIEHPDYETVTAQQVMPDKVQVDNINFLPDAGIDEDGDEAAGVELTFTDTPGLDYYQVSVHRRHISGIIASPSNSSSTDPSTYQTDSRAILIEDALFEGEQKTILIKFDRDLANELLSVDFRKLNEAQYKHLRTTDRAQETGDNPFQTPVQVFSNGSNGFGLFAMYSKNVVEIN